MHTHRFYAIKPIATGVLFYFYFTKKAAYVLAKTKHTLP
jgi:hypothetical protein